jgi:hypothetical protein
MMISAVTRYGDGCVGFAAYRIVRQLLHDGLREPRRAELVGYAMADPTALDLAFTRRERTRADELETSEAAATCRRQATEPVDQTRHVTLGGGCSGSSSRFSHRVRGLSPTVRML